MRLLVSLAAAALLSAVLLLAGCSGEGGNAQKGNAGASNARKDTAGQPQHPDNVRRVTITELRDMLDQGKAVVVDVRTPEMYGMEHIKGALLIPEAQVGARATELPKDKLIAFYCS